MAINLKKLKLFIIGIPGSPHIHDRSQCFARLGHEVTLFSRIDNGTVSEKFIKIFPNSKLFQNCVSAVKLFIELQKKNPDVIHIHYAYTPLAWLVPFVSGKPIVVSLMGGDILFDEQGSPTVFGKKLTLNLLHRSNLITSKSKFIGSYLSKIDPRLEEKNKTIIWGIDLRKFRKIETKIIKEKLNLKTGDLVILSPRSLKPLYNIDLIIKALPKIVNAQPNTKLLITEYKPEKEYRNKIISLIDELNLNNHIIFTGRIGQNYMPMYYNLADINITIPSSDGIPQSLLEAMGCEVPNVISNLHRYTEIVQHGESAYFTELDSQNIADSVLRLVRDVDLKNKIIRNAKNIVHRQANFQLNVKEIEADYYDQMRNASKHANYFIVRIKALLFFFCYFLELFVRKLSVPRN